MPMPKPRKGESQSDYMGRCMHEMSQGSDRTNEQNVAACMQGWRDAHGGKKPSKAAQISAVIERFKEKFTDPERLALLARAMSDCPDPEDGESKQDYVDRCVDEMTSGDDGMDEGDAEDACEMAYEDAREEQTGEGAIVHKTHATEGKGVEFILSDATPDRFGDIVQVEGWEFSNFTKNPVALFSHRADFPIGTWTGIKVHDKALRGSLILAPKGISPRIDEIRGLVEAGILRAVSVGFKPLASHPVDTTKNDPFGFGPQVFTKSELVEVSLVAIPANPNALAVAKSLNISAATRSLVFAEHGNQKTRDGGAAAYARTRAEHGNQRTQAITAKTGKTNPAMKGGSVMLLSERIVAAEKFLVTLQDQLTAHLDTVDDQNPDDAALAVTEDLNQKIASAERNLSTLKQAEQRLARATADRTNGNGREIVRGSTAFTQPARSNGDGPRPFGMTAKKITPVEYLIRQGVVAAFMHTKHLNAEQAQQLCGYADDECTKAYVDYCQKAATAVAMTSVTGWAAELAQQVYGDFLQLLAPSAVMPALAAKGLALTFGRAGKIVIPARSATPSLAGSFVGEGAPIPVRQGAFTTVSLVPKKLGVITTFTREINEHSIPAIEGILRDSVAQDTSVAIDTVLLDANPATAIRPSGLRNGVSGLTPTAGGGYAAFIGDLKALAGALLTATAGHVRAPVIIMNPQQALSISLMQPANAAAPLFPFSDEIANGRLRNFAVITSGNVPLTMVIALDAADFVTAGDEAPRFEVSDQATLHLEDTSPQDITGGTPSPAVPVKSMFQTDSLALRLVWPLNWALRRTGMVAWVTGVTW